MIFKICERSVILVWLQKGDQNAKYVTFLSTNIEYVETAL